MDSSGEMYDNRNRNPTRNEMKIKENGQMLTPYYGKYNIYACKILFFSPPLYSTLYRCVRSPTVFSSIFYKLQHVLTRPNPSANRATYTSGCVANIVLKTVGDAHRSLRPCRCARCRGRRERRRRRGGRGGESGGEGGGWSADGWPEDLTNRSRRRSVFN